MKYIKWLLLGIGIYILIYVVFLNKILLTCISSSFFDYSYFDVPKIEINLTDANNKPFNDEKLRIKIIVFSKEHCDSGNGERVYVFFNKSFLLIDNRIYLNDNYSVIGFLVEIYNKDELYKVFKEGYDFHDDTWEYLTKGTYTYTIDKSDYEKEVKKSINRYIPEIEYNVHDKNISHFEIYTKTK